MILGAEPKNQVIWIIRCKVMAPNKSGLFAPTHGRVIAMTERKHFFLQEVLPKTDMSENRCNCITGGDHTEFLYPSSLCVCQSNRIKDVRSQFCSVDYILYLPLHSTNEFIDIFGPFTAHKAPCNMDFGGSLINFHIIFFPSFLLKA